MPANRFPHLQVRPELLDQGWTADDGLIRRYIYHHDKTLKARMEVMFCLNPKC